MGIVRLFPRQIDQASANVGDALLWNATTKWTPTTLTSANISGFTESVQDVVGGLVLDSATIDFTYDDVANTLSAAAITQMTITSDASGIKLVNDDATPGNNKIYGTNGSGVKGWFDSPSGADGNGIYSGSGNIGQNIASSYTAAKVPTGAEFALTFSNNAKALSIVDNDAVYLKNRTGTQGVVLPDIDGVVIYTANGELNLSDKVYTGMPLFVDTIGNPINPKAIFEIASTTKVMFPPRMTTAQRNLIAMTATENGAIVYNTSTGKLNIYVHPAWVELQTGGDGNGIYSGSGIIPDNTVATLTASGDFTFDYNGGNDALRLNDGVTPLITLTSKDTFTSLNLSNTGVSILNTVSADTLFELLDTQVRLVYDEGGLAPQEFIVDSTGARLESTTKMFRPPRMTTAQRDLIATPEAGGILYNTTTQKLTYRDGSAFIELASNAPGNGGIYGGSGTIPGSTVATITTAFTIDYAGGSDAMLVDNTANSISFKSKDGTNRIQLDNATGIRISTNTVGKTLDFTGNNSNSQFMTYITDLGGSIEASGILDVASTTKAFYPPRMTAAQRDLIATPANGAVVYTSDLNALSVRANGAWTVIPNSGGGGSIPLSSVSAATADTTVDHTTRAIIWNWNSVTTQTALKLNGNNVASGTLLDISTSSATLNSTNGLLRVRNTSAQQTGKLAEFVANSGAGSGMTWLANGKVGVNTAAPATQLHVVGGDGIRLETGIFHAKSTGNDFTTVATASAIRLENTTAVNGRKWYIGSRDDGNLRIGNEDNPYVDIQKSTGMFVPFNSFALPGVSSISALGANTNNWDPNPNQDTTVWRFSATGAINITGISASYQGRIIYLVNTGANLITLKKDDANSNAANRILMRTDIVMAQDNVVQIWYDTTDSKWRVISQS